MYATPPKTLLSRRARLLTPRALLALVAGLAGCSVTHAADDVDLGEGAVVAPSPVTSIAGFPLAEVEPRASLFSDDASLESARFVTAPLFEEELSLVEAGLTHLNGLSAGRATIQVGYRYFDHALFSNASASKGTIFLLSGGPALYSDYMQARVKVLLQNGFDVALMDQRGTRDNRPATIAAGGPRVGATIPLLDEASDVDPLVVAEVARFERVASDLDRVVGDVMTMPGKEGQPFFVMGHSAGGELLTHYLARLGRGRSNFVPAAVVFSGAALPGTHRLGAWAFGTKEQARIFEERFLANPAVEPALVGLFAKIASLAATPERAEICARLVHNVLGFTVEDTASAPDDMVAEVDGYARTLDAGGVDALVDELVAANRYYFNKLYSVLVPLTIGGGLTDGQTSDAVEALLPALGVGPGILSRPWQPSLGRALSGYDFVHADPSRVAYNTQVATLASSGRLAWSEARPSVVLDGMKRVGTIVAFNGDHDPMAAPSYMFGGLQSEFVGLHDFADFDDARLRTFMIHAPVGHAGLFANRTDADGKFEAPSPQLDLVIKAIRREVPDATLRADAMVVSSAAELAAMRRAYDETKNVVIFNR